PAGAAALGFLEGQGHAHGTHIAPCIGISTQGGGTHVPGTGQVLELHVDDALDDFLWIPVIDLAVQGEPVGRVAVGIVHEPAHALHGGQGRELRKVVGDATAGGTVRCGEVVAGVQAAAGAEAHGPAGGVAGAVAIGTEYTQRLHVADHDDVAVAEGRRARRVGCFRGATHQVRGEGTQLVASAQQLDHIGTGDVVGTIVLKAVQREVDRHVPVVAVRRGRGATFDDVADRVVDVARIGAGLADIAREQLECDLAALLQAPEVLGRAVGGLVGGEDADRGADHQQAQGQRDHEFNQADTGLARARGAEVMGVLKLHMALTVTTWRVVLPSPVSASPSSAPAESCWTAPEPRLSSHCTMTVQTPASQETSAQVLASLARPIELFSEVNQTLNSPCAEVWPAGCPAPPVSAVHFMPLVL